MPPRGSLRNLQLEGKRPNPAQGASLSCYRPLCGSSETQCPWGAAYSPQAAPTLVSRDWKPGDSFWASSPPKPVLRGQVTSVTHWDVAGLDRNSGSRTTSIYLEVLCSTIQPSSPPNTHWLVLTHEVRISMALKLAGNCQPGPLVPSDCPGVIRSTRGTIVLARAPSRLLLADRVI